MFKVKKKDIRVTSTNYVVANIICFYTQKNSIP